MSPFVARAKDKDDPFRLMGFGHRIYKNFDPRARIIKQAADDVLDALGIDDDPLLDIAMELEQVALSDDYFVERKLYPNVDFYSGIIYRALGFPDRHVHRALRPGPTSRVDRPVAGAACRPDDEDLPPHAGLCRAGPKTLRPDRGPVLDPLDRFDIRLLGDVARHRIDDHQGALVWRLHAE